MRKFERILVAMSSVALLATAACGTTTEADGDAVDGTASDASSGTDATGDTGPAVTQYFYLVIYDADNPDCSTTGPGADIDSIELVVNGATIGTGKIGGADLVAGSPKSVTPCEKCGANKDKDCSHAKDPVDNAMGPTDAKIYCGNTSDTGYVSLNGGSLRLQIAGLDGKGDAQFMQAGDVIRVHEVDKSYQYSDDPSKCNAPKDENYSIEIRKDKDSSGIILKSKAGTDSGTGVTEFVVP